MKMIFAAQHGTVGLCVARQHISAMRQHFDFRGKDWPGTARHGWAWLGMARQHIRRKPDRNYDLRGGAMPGTARLGNARQHIALRRYSYSIALMTPAIQAAVALMHQQSQR